MTHHNDAVCLSCGYSLRGHSGRLHKCPECGRENTYPAIDDARPLRHGWSVAAVATTAVGLMLMLGFRLLLWLKHLRVMDLWNGASPLSGPPKPGATGLVGIGSILAAICFYLAVLDLAYCLIVAGVAVRRHDPRTLLATGLCAVLSVVYGLLAFQLGLILAGV